MASLKARPLPTSAPSTSSRKRRNPGGEISYHDQDPLGGHDDYGDLGDHVDQVDHDDDDNLQTLLLFWPRLASLLSESLGR